MLPILEVRWSGCVHLVSEDFCYNCSLYLVFSNVACPKVLQLFCFLGIHAIIPFLDFFQMCCLVYLLLLDLWCLRLQTFLLVFLLFIVLSVALSVDIPFIASSVHFLCTWAWCMAEVLHVLISSSPWDMLLLLCWSPPCTVFQHRPETSC